MTMPFPLFPFPACRRNCYLCLGVLLFISVDFGLQARAIEPPRESLFNGNDLDGWIVKCRPADCGRGFWYVEDGAIVADTLDHDDHDYVWLQTAKEFDDFELSLQFQAYRFSPGNSGVQIRSRYDESAGWLDGPQIDIHPPGPWRTGFIWDETRGVQRWLHPAGISRPEEARPELAVPQRPWKYDVVGGTSDQWNGLRIRCRKNRIQVWLNDVLITDYEGSGILDDAVHQRRRVGRSGHIALQIHRGDRLKMRFRNIRIREID